MATPPEIGGDIDQLRASAQQRQYIDRRLTELFAAEDDALRSALAALDANDMPHIQISPVEGRLLQVLAAACGARKILEIGALSGYSSIWLARALPAGGRLISLEVSEKHARVARASLVRAGLDDRAEVRVGPARESLAQLLNEAPFDLIFIDADKPGYGAYLDWAIQLARPGSIIVADNCVRRGEPLRENLDEITDEGNRVLAQYNQRIASDPRLLSVTIPVDDGGLDGFAISVVLAATSDATGTATATD